MIVFQRAQPIDGHCYYHIETSLLMCTANRWSGFYMKGALVNSFMTKVAII